MFQNIAEDIAASVSCSVFMACWKMLLLSSYELENSEQTGQIYSPNTAWASFEYLFTVIPVTTGKDVTLQCLDAQMRSGDNHVERQRMCYDEEVMGRGQFLSLFLNKSGPVVSVLAL